MKNSGKLKANWKEKALEELIHYWVCALYMGMLFGVFTNYRRLVLAHYNIIYRAYGVAAIKALVLAKVVLVADGMHLGRRLEKRPLAVAALCKSLLFTLCVGVFDVAESLIDSFIHGQNPTEAVHELVNRFNFEWLSGALVIFCAFIPFFIAQELGRVFGGDVMFKLFFRARPEGGRIQNGQEALLK